MMHRLVLLYFFVFVVSIYGNAQGDYAPAPSPLITHPASPPVHRRAKHHHVTSPAKSPVFAPTNASPLTSPVYPPAASPLVSAPLNSPVSPVKSPVSAPTMTPTATAPSNQPPEIAATSPVTSPGIPSTPANAPDIFPYGRGPVSIPSPGTATLAPETAVLPAGDKSASKSIHHDVLFTLLILVATLLL